MLIKKSQRREKQLAKDSFVWEYPLHNKNLGIATAKINGRFPESGRTLNKVCQEIYCVVSGSGKLFVEDEEIGLEEGDVYLIDSGKKYYVIGRNLVLVCPTHPEWYPGQQEIVKD
jgi:mannose-6-phosphate isomerase-like protein (cupin superfamily)